MTTARDKKKACSSYLSCDSRLKYVLKRRFSTMKFPNSCKNRTVTKEKARSSLLYHQRLLKKRYYFEKNHSRAQF